ncbi:MAG: hypothetical protein K2Q11_04915 [Burkholderiaceae bacterium]|nr:hypothetical protein [Burkholderiaceae bacterium]
MKYLVWLIILVLAYAWWRSQRRTQCPPTATQPAPQAMVVCAHCGLHLPRTEALTVRQRYYCCADHQRQNVG